MDQAVYDFRLSTPELLEHRRQLKVKLDEQPSEPPPPLKDPFAKEDVPPKDALSEMTPTAWAIVAGCTLVALLFLGLQVREWSRRWRRAQATGMAKQPASNSEIPARD